MFWKVAFLFSIMLNKSLDSVHVSRSLWIIQLNEYTVYKEENGYTIRNIGVFCNHKECICTYLLCTCARISVESISKCGIAGSWGSTSITIEVLPITLHNGCNNLLSCQEYGGVFIEIYFTCHVTHPFKVYNSLVEDFSLLHITEYLESLTS